MLFILLLLSAPAAILLAWLVSKFLHRGADQRKQRRQSTILLSLSLIGVFVIATMYIQSYRAQQAVRNAFDNSPSASFLKQYYPDIHQSLRQSVLQYGAYDSNSQVMVLSAMQDVKQQIITLIPRASTHALLRHLDSQTLVLKQLAAHDPSACHTVNYSRDPNLVLPILLSTHDDNTEQRTLSTNQAIIDSQADTNLLNPDSSNQAQQDLDTIYATLAQSYGRDMQFLQRHGFMSSLIDRTKSCAIMIDFTQAITDYPPERAANIVRLLHSVE